MNDMRRHVERFAAMTAEQREARELAAVAMLDQIGARLLAFAADLRLTRLVGPHHRVGDPPCRD